MAWRYSLVLMSSREGSESSEVMLSMTPADLREPSPVESLNRKLKSCWARRLRAGLQSSDPPPHQAFRHPPGGHGAEEHADEDGPERVSGLSVDESVDMGQGEVSLKDSEDGIGSHRRCGRSCCCTPPHRRWESPPTGPARRPRNSRRSQQVSVDSSGRPKARVAHRAGPILFIQGVRPRSNWEATTLPPWVMRVGCPETPGSPRPSGLPGDRARWPDDSS